MKHSGDGKFYRYNTTFLQIKEADFTNSMNTKDEQCQKPIKLIYLLLYSLQKMNRAGVKWLPLV